MVTEAGFGADLGAEKFLDIKCRFGNLKPDAAVIVATIKALKMHGGVAKTELQKENTQALDMGIANLKRHVSNIKKFGLPVIVAVNKFIYDTDKEVELLIKRCEEMNVKVSLCDCWAEGGAGGEDLANKLVDILSKEPSEYKPLYDVNLSIEEKVNTIVTQIYGGKGAVFESVAKKQIKRLKELGLDKMPVCIAKTQFSFSDNPSAIGAPEDFEITVKDVRVSAGAGFIVCQTSNIMVMPGLSKKPAAENMDVDNDGHMKGLF